MSAPVSPNGTSGPVRDLSVVSSLPPDLVKSKWTLSFVERNVERDFLASFRAADAYRMRNLYLCTFAAVVLILIVTLLSEEDGDGTRDGVYLYVGILGVLILAIASTLLRPFAGAHHRVFYVTWVICLMGAFLLSLLELEPEAMGNGNGNVNVIFLLLVPFLVAQNRYWIMVLVGMGMILVYLILSLGSTIKSTAHVFAFAILYACAVVAGGRVAYAIERGLRRHFADNRRLGGLRQQLEHEQTKMVNLLRNVLPEQTTQRLMSTVPGELLSEEYARSTVMFIKVVGLPGFTAPADTDDALKLVSLLDQVFSYLDAVTARYGLEKIKTNMNCYILAGGVPDAPGTEEDDVRVAVSVAQMALEVREGIHNVLDDTRLDVRIGAAYGPLVGGVIGSKTLTFDIWGDTVNVASRLETFGKVGAIHINESLRDALLQSRDRSVSTIVGPHVVDIKGKGTMRTFFLLGSPEEQATIDLQQVEPVVSTMLSPHLSAHDMELEDQILDASEAHHEDADDDAAHDEDEHGGAPVPAAQHGLTEKRSASSKRLRALSRMTVHAMHVVQRTASAVAKRTGAAMGVFFEQAPRHIVVKFHPITQRFDSKWAIAFARERYPHDCDREGFDSVRTLELAYRLYYHRKFRRLTRGGLLLGGAFGLAYSVVSMLVLGVGSDSDEWLDGNKVLLIVLLQAASSLPQFLLAAVSTSKFFLLWSRILLPIVTVLTIGMQSVPVAHLAWDDGRIYLASLFAVSVLHAFSQLVSSFIYSVVGLALLACSLVGVAAAQEDENANNVLVLSATALLALLCGIGTRVVRERTARAEFIMVDRLVVGHTRMVAEENKRRNLVSSCLPKSVVSHFDFTSDDKSAQSLAAFTRRFDNTCVGFCDICSFTVVSSVLSASSIVAMLSIIFRGYDQVMEKYGLYKIKTLGDCFVWAAGIDTAGSHSRMEDNERARTNARNMCLATIDMVGVLDRFNANRPDGFPEIRMRFGVKMGPTVAGIVGRRKYTYDLWGGTVVAANEMEAEGVPMAVHVDTVIFERLQHDPTFHFEPRTPSVEILSQPAKTYLVSLAPKSIELGLQQLNVDPNETNVDFWTAVAKFRLVPDPRDWARSLADATIASQDARHDDQTHQLFRHLHAPAVHKRRGSLFVRKKKKKKETPPSPLSKPKNGDHTAIPPLLSKKSSGTLRQ